MLYSGTHSGYAPLNFDQIKPDPQHIHYYKEDFVSPISEQEMTRLIYKNLKCKHKGLFIDYPEESRQYSQFWEPLAEKIFNENRFENYFQYTILGER